MPPKKVASEIPNGVLMIRAAPKSVEYGHQFIKTYVAYQKGRRDAFATIREYGKMPTEKDYHRYDTGSIVVLHGTSYFAITPELEGPIWKENLRVSSRDRVASSVLPDPVVMATLGSMSLDL